MEKQGFVQFYRKIHDWEWYTDSFTFHLFFHCVSSANFKTKKWRGIEIKRGQFITGRKKLSVETGLSEQQVRTCLKRLQSTNDITINSTTSYSIITVNNFEKYQKISGNQPTKQPTINQRLTTTNNDNNEYSNTSYINISLSIEEREILSKYLLKQKRKNPIEDIDAYINTLSKNGDLKYKLEKALQWNARKQAKKQEEQQIKEEKSETPINTEEDEQKIKEIQEQIKSNRKRG